MAAQFLTTSKLSNIISMITLGRQSGILRVMRGQGPVREMGQIKFYEGTPITALLGQVTGPSALSVLSNWGECIYAFDEQPITDFGDADTAPDGRQLPAESPRITSSFPSGSWPAYGPSSPPPFSQPAAPTPQPAQSGAYDSGFPSGFPAQAGYSQPGGYASAYDMQRAPGAASVSIREEAVAADLLMTVPRRTMLSEHVEQLPLDRRERMILLLVDGKRTVTDLARLTRRNEREVLAVLDHLGGLGLLQM